MGFLLADLPTLLLRKCDDKWPLKTHYRHVKTSGVNQPIDHRCPLETRSPGTDLVSEAERNRKTVLGYADGNVQRKPKKNDKTAAMKK